MATKSGTRHKLTKDHKDQVRQEIPPGFNEAAHRFAKETRKNVEKNRKFMQVNPNEIPPDTKLFTPTPRLNAVEPGTTQAHRRETREMPLGSRPPRETAEGVRRYDIYASAEQGLAKMETPTDKMDQFYDNVNWYSGVYGKMPKAGYNERGLDLGRVKLGPEYFDYVERKRNKAMTLQYDMYKLQMVDLSTPSLRQYWQNRFPDLVERKLLYIQNKARLMAKLQEVNARGVQDMEDMKFIYMYNLGVFDKSTPEDVASYINNPMESKMWNVAMEGGESFYENPMMHENRDDTDERQLSAMEKRVLTPSKTGMDWRNMEWGPNYGGPSPEFMAAPTLY